MEILLTYIDEKDYEWQVSLEHHMYILKRKSPKGRVYKLIKEERELENILILVPGYEHLLKKDKYNMNICILVQTSADMYPFKEVISKEIRDIIIKYNTTKNYISIINFNVGIGIYPLTTQIDIQDKDIDKYISLDFLQYCSYADIENSILELLEHLNNELMFELIYVIANSNIIENTEYNIVEILNDFYPDATIENKLYNINK